jgi:hypothetical protein
LSDIRHRYRFFDLLRSVRVDRRAAEMATPELRVLALPNGYAYRLGSARHIGIGLVGRGECLDA